MPKVKPLVKEDPAEKKRREIRAWIDGNMRLKGIGSYRELSKLTGIPASTISKRVRFPETIVKAEEWALIGVLGEMER